MCNNQLNIGTIIKRDIRENITAIRIAAQLMSRQSEGRQTHPIAQSIVHMAEQVGYAVLSLQKQFEKEKALPEFGLCIHGEKHLLSSSLLEKFYCLAQAIYQLEHDTKSFEADVMVTHKLATLELKRAGVVFFTYATMLNN